MFNTVDEAIISLKQGKFVLVHDDKHREDEIDMVLAAEFITPFHVSKMRLDAGGLLCLALDYEISKNLQLQFMHDILSRFSNNDFLLSKMSFEPAPYGDKPSFSISINHKSTFTGITDKDRSFTISELASICKNMNNNSISDFAKNFRTPGHVNLLIASKGLIKERFGHTELAVYLTKIAGLTPTAVICEMLDSKTFKALSIEKAKLYANKFNIPILESKQLKAYSVA